MGKAMKPRAKRAKACFAWVPCEPNGDLWPRWSMTCKGELLSALRGDAGGLAFEGGLLRIVRVKLVPVAPTRRKR